MSNSLTRLFPLPPEELPLQGAYLAHDLRTLAEKSAKPFVLANFVTSVDGRIAVPQGDGNLGVPMNVANERDWRLFQELAAQADVIISSGRYLRDWADGEAQEILQIDDPRFADLRTWREQRGLTPHPDIAIISGSLDFPVPEVLQAGGRRLVVVTTEGHDLVRVQAIEEAGGTVLAAGEGQVDGALLIEKMQMKGYRVIYSAAGPRIHHLLLEAGVLDRLYLTFVNRLLGGGKSASILEGDLMVPAVDLRLNSVYHDPHGLDGLGQLFLSYNCVTS